MDATLYISPHRYFAECARVATALDPTLINTLRTYLLDISTHDRTVFIIGNGGFATVADHLALGLSLNTLRETGRGLRALTLNSSGAHATAALNDFGANDVFAAPLEALGRSGDLLIALSGSGASLNIACAVARAHNLGITTACIVGREGEVSAHADLTICLNHDSNAVCEDVAIMVLHWVYGTFMLGQQW